MAELGVRPASAADVDEISRVQLDTWSTAYAKILPRAVLDDLRPEAVRAAWRAAVTTPPSDRHQVLVAYDHDGVVGFVASAPATPDDTVDDLPDGTLEVTALLVEPRWGRRGHGSRLLAATADLARVQGFTAAVHWALAADVAIRSLLTSTGWAPDGHARDLDMAGTPVRERRFHTDLRDG
jgi:ribosomal protein S18 acetylase RimI-like enzyme